ncbi:uncharacterized protein N7477_001043 [Penicillium maclennaniae]|uniref:uncharacterized protein n=1 Tax=Penicillium maclennaniae TaxID=1343394 RepID=UPI0025418CF6|nr:uncharacterized protein N7477_001043 [Penicillium maclennaniae]KAJ5684698.1 hypothetical protein N7477_001043 [Penicillium maclennaniae]
MENQTKDNEPAPSYADIFQNPTNIFSGVRVPTLQVPSFHVGYTRVNQESDAEAGDIHNHGDGAIPLNPRPVDGQAHVHCEVCDRQMDRREKAKHQQYTCHVVSRTFILITLFMMIFGIVAVTTAHKRRKGDGGA